VVRIEDRFENKGEFVDRLSTAGNGQQINLKTFEPKDDDV